MGATYIYYCKNCGYQAESSGKLDSGMMAVVEPYICNNCKELTDVLVGEYGHKINKSDLTDNKTDFYVCTFCGSENITIWNIKKRPCPKCGSKMKKGQEAFMWD